MTETTKKARKRKPSGPFSDELLDQLLAQASGKDAESLLGESGLIGQLKKQLAERMLAAELSHHLASEAADEGAGNHRNGTTSKTVLTPSGALDLDIPRDRLSTFEPQLVAMYQRRLPIRRPGNQHVCARHDHARDSGASGRAIWPGSLPGADFHHHRRSHGRGGRVASPPARRHVPLVYFDALRLKIRDEGTVRNKAVDLALGIDATGRKDVLGLWIEQTEGGQVLAQGVQRPQAAWRD